MKSSSNAPRVGAIFLCAIPIKDSVFVEAKVDKEVMESHDDIKKLKPSHALGTESCLCKLRKLTERPDDLENPMGLKMKQGAVRTACDKAKICAPNTIRGAFNRIKQTEKDYAAKSSNPKRTDETAIFDRFTDSLVKELKELEPDGAASRDRANCLSSDAIEPIQEDVQILHENQQALQLEMVNWVSALDKAASNKTLDEKQIKKLVMDIIKEHTAAQKLECAPIQNSTSGPKLIKRLCDRCCHTKGVNFSCGRKIDNPDDHIPCKKPGPNHDPTAAFQNQKGGNSKRNDKAHKHWVGYEDGRQGRVVDN